MGSIYKITNTVNGKAYIGQTRHDAEKTRMRDHFNGHGNRILKNSVKNMDVMPLPLKYSTMALFQSFLTYLK